MGSAVSLSGGTPMPHMIKTNLSWKGLSQVLRKIITQLETFLDSIVHGHFLQRYR